MAARPTPFPHFSIARFFRTLIAGFIGVSLALAAVTADVRAESDPCKPPNVLPASVCDFDGWHGDPPRQVADGWTEWILSGNPDFYRDEHSFFGGGTQTIRSGEPFKAGIWTQVGVTPGAGYRASIAWGAPNLPAEFGRQLGIDPTGGTDPNAPTVIWGPQHFGDGRMLNYATDGPNIDLRVRAVADRMTLFFAVDRPSSSGDGLIFIDAIALYPDESAPPPIGAAPAPATVTPPPPAPTDTPPPPSETPTQPPAAPSTAPEASAAAPADAAAADAAPAAGLAAAAASAPVDAQRIIEPPGVLDPPSATPTVAPTATPPPTATPTQVPTATPSPTLSPTPSPTWTPWPTAAPPGFVDALGASMRSGDLATLRQTPTSTWTLTALGAFALAGALLFGGSLFWLRRR